MSNVCNLGNSLSIRFPKLCIYIYTQYIYTYTKESYKFSMVKSFNF